jgi:hypothetical protein
MNRALKGQTILIICWRPTPYVVELRQALEACGAETMVAGNPDRAISLLGRFAFSTVVVGVLTHDAPGALLDRLVPMPTVFYADATPVAAVVQAVADLQSRPWPPYRHKRNPRVS